MSMKLTIPIMGKPKTVKDTVIGVLSREWPLTARKIYNKVRKTYGLDVTYQAVHKALIEMLEENVLMREGRDYSISIEWVRNNKQFYERLEAKREGSGHPTPEDIFNEEVTKLEFENLYDYYSHILEFSWYIAATPDPITHRIEGPVSAQLYHIFWILAATKNQEEGLRYIMKLSPESYFVCKGDTTTDRLLAKYFESLGANVKTGVKCAELCDILAGGGIVIQTYFTRSLKRELDTLYKNFGNVTKTGIKKRKGNFRCG